MHTAGQPNYHSSDYALCCIYVPVPTRYFRHSLAGNANSFEWQRKWRTAFFLSLSLGQLGHIIQRVTFSFVRLSAHVQLLRSQNRSTHDAHIYYNGINIQCHASIAFSHISSVTKCRFFRAQTNTQYFEYLFMDSISSRLSWKTRPTLSTTGESAKRGYDDCSTYCMDRGNPSASLNIWETWENSSAVMFPASVLFYYKTCSSNMSQHFCLSPDLCYIFLLYSWTGLHCHFSTRGKL